MHCDSNNSIICVDNQSSHKWQITLMSKNCTIRKQLEGWQVCIKKFYGLQISDIFYRQHFVIL